jgi:hypothetical protein
MARKCDDCISTPLVAFEQGVYSIHGHERRARTVALSYWLRSERFLLGLAAPEGFGESTEWPMETGLGENFHDYHI